MNYREKIKTRLYIAIIYIGLGVIMIVGAFTAKPDNEFISAFGLAMMIMGITRIRNYMLITRNENTLRSQETKETDERNLFIQNKAKSTTFSLYFLIAGTAVIILSLFNMHEIAKWIAYSVLLLAVIYWICYWIYQKKL